MRIFFVLPRVPYPTEKGDKLRAFHQIKHLSRNHEIIICALNDGVLHNDAIPVLKKYAKAVHVIPVSRFTVVTSLLNALFTGKPLQVGYFFNKAAKKQVDALIREYRPDHIFCQLIRVAEYVKDQPGPKTLDYQDVFSKGMERRMATASCFMRPFLKLEYKRLLKYEHDIFEKFTNRIIISEPDRALIPHPGRDQIVVVANGVDTEFFHPLERPREYDLVFTGNMGYPPNINAAEFLVNRILPIVTKRKPDTRLLIAGANPNMRILVLRSPQVEVTGWVPDMRECYAGARIFIAPMQLGTGLQNKLLEAMAMKVPCITSPLANQALQAKPGEEILVAETPADYAEAVLSLLNDPAFAQRIGENGNRFVMRNYNWEKETLKIESLIINP